MFRVIFVSGSQPLHKLAYGVAHYSPSEVNFDYLDVIYRSPEAIAMPANVLFMVNSRTDWHLRRLISRAVKEGIQIQLSSCIEEDMANWSEAYQVFERAKKRHGKPEAEVNRICSDYELPPLKPTPPIPPKS